MLTHLSVRNVVLIDKIDLDLSSGLTVFTGETGAGKSILLDALSLALGTRAETGLIRHGEKEASVTACFSVPISHLAGVLLSAHGYDFSGEVILRRVISKDGHSKAFVNDEPVSISFLKSVGDLLVEIHGQFASHRLLNPATHLETLDRFAGVGEALADCRHTYTQWQYKRKQRLDAEEALLQARSDEAFLTDSVKDLEKLNPQPGEEEKLTALRTKLMNGEKILTALGHAREILSNDDQGGLSLLGQALTQLERANEWSNQELSPLVDQVSQAFSLLSEATSDLEKAQEKWGDLSELSQIDDRLFSLRDMARKHQVSISELPELLNKLKNQLSQLELGESAIENIRQEEEKERLSYISKAGVLSAERLAAANRLNELVSGELPDLKLGKAKFKTDIQKADEADWNETGWDKVSFLVSTNKGMPLSPIHKVASGGELARFMLALKVNLATADDVETLIFDEVDSGVGGSTAAAVGARLKRLADTHQVLVVTHSPQVAAYGQAHFSVRKEENDQGVLTYISAVEADDRQAEIARMLSGEKVTQTALTMAGELLETCSKK